LGGKKKININDNSTATRDRMYVSGWSGTIFFSPRSSENGLIYALRDGAEERRMDRERESEEVTKRKKNPVSHTVEVC
jgi:hypothetical protein